MERSFIILRFVVHETNTDIFSNRMPDYNDFIGKTRKPQRKFVFIVYLGTDLMLLGNLIVVFPILRKASNI